MASSVCPVTADSPHRPSTLAPSGAGRTIQARMFHEGGSVLHLFAKQINLKGKLLGIVTLVKLQFAPIHFQEKCGVTA